MSRSVIGALTALLLIIGTAVAVMAGGRGEHSTSQTADSPVPQLSIPRLDGGPDFALASLSSADSPTLLWFWAPWCEICNQEAARIEGLAESAGDELTVIAIGGRDNATNGPAFVEAHGLRSPTVLFDESLAAWQAYGIQGQPGAVLLDRGGVERGRWAGPFDPEAALAAARAL